MHNFKLMAIKQKANEMYTHCPVKAIRVLKDSPDWFSWELLEEIYQRDCLYKQAKFSKVENDWVLFKNKRKEVKKLINQVKESYVTGKLDEERHDPKRFLQSLNELTGVGCSKTKVGLSTVITDDQHCLEGTDATNYMN